MAICLLGLGSNLGDRAGNLFAALEALRNHGAIRLLQASSLIETLPVGGSAGQGRYLNAAAVVETELAPTDLLCELLAIEQRLGRQRGERW
ncbi:MAG: 2-amino-4-hydroxy-6-hydroxymethyldihydropteridine diphosphokinase, partial [Pirellulaceae bacterium]